MKIFISACSEDYLETNFIKSKLEDFALTNEITFWYADDDNIPAGSDLSIILDNITESQGAILLVSNAFLASDFITKKELPLILEKNAADPDYKLVLVLLDKETDFKNFGEISLEEKKYINSKNTAFKGLTESESLLQVSKIIKALLQKTTKSSSKESIKVLNRINLMRAMINELNSNFESNITRRVDSYISSGGISDIYSSTKMRWDEDLIRYKKVAERTRYELMDFSNMNKKLKALDESQYKQLEDVIELVLKLKVKLEESIEKSCQGWQKFNSTDEAKKEDDSKGPYGEEKTIFLCILCKSFHKGYGENIDGTNMHIVEEMQDYADELRDQY
jgi:hypothetical protein|tara:strand:+ start:418 stop:1422 length:1005 start_codon:yes stop_codon:yes gene_type:complete